MSTIHDMLNTSCTQEMVVDVKPDPVPMTDSPLLDTWPTYDTTHSSSSPSSSPQYWGRDGVDEIRQFIYS
jgi:hypothetical protein